MTPAILLGILLSGTIDLTATMGGAMPFGDLEFNNRGGTSGSFALGYNHGASHWELGNELLSLPGSRQPDYSLSIYRVSVSYHHALLNNVGWQLRAGGGIDWSNLTRALGTRSEQGSVLGGTLAISYVRSFGHPKFVFQLYGSELVDPGQPGVRRTFQGATLIGARLGAGYEF